MPTGTVSWYSAERGFGYIAPDGGGLEVFAHRSEVDPLVAVRLRSRTKVVYDLDPTSSSPQALRIQAI